MPKESSKSVSNSTVSGPRKGRRDASGDAAVRKMRGTQDLAAAFPFNANKPNEIGDASKKPKPGRTVEPSRPSVTGSTLTESNATPKTGAQARPGFNPGNDPLDRVRVDSSGQVLTTNFAQPVADNQNSLKAGSRYTGASFLSEKGKRTPVFVRFSTVAGERGSTDTPRDVSAFVEAVGKHRNWDRG